MRPLHFTTLTVPKNNFILEILRKWLIPGGSWWDPALIVIDWFQKAAVISHLSYCMLGVKSLIGYLRLEVIVDFQLNHPSAGEYSQDFRCHLGFAKSCGWSAAVLLRKNLGIPKFSVLKISSAALKLVWLLWWGGKLQFEICLLDSEHKRQMSPDGLVLLLGPFQ